MIYERRATVESAPMKGETILFDPSSVKFCTLNQSAAFVWERLAAPRSVRDLLVDLGGVYGIDDCSTIEQQLRELLDEFVGLSLVTASADPDGNVSGRPAAYRAAGSRGAYSPYERPRITVLNEAEILASFQVTTAGMTWWIAPG